MTQQLLNRMKGGLFGLAIGDALGVTTEFMSKEQIEKSYGAVTEIIGGGWLELEPGEVSDDTEMTIAVAKGIVESHDDPIESIGMFFLKWYYTEPKDIGNIISSTISLYDGDWFEAAYKTHKQMNGKSAGNGSLMRCLPIALAYPELNKMIEFTKKQSKMTHYDEETAYICVLYNKIASLLLQCISLKDAIFIVLQDTDFEYCLHNVPSEKPSGYVVDTFEWVIYWLLQKQSFSDVVLAATNEGGDADTIAAICGGLKGIEAGYENLPKEFTTKLICGNELEVLAKCLYRKRIQEWANSI